MVPSCADLRAQVLNKISDQLKLVFVKNARQQQIKVIYSEGFERIVQNYIEIGESFADDGTKQNINKLYHIIVIGFTKTYKYDIKKVMTDLNLVHSCNFNFKGSIARIVFKRKGDMVSIFQRYFI